MLLTLAMIQVIFHTVQLFEAILVFMEFDIGIAKYCDFIFKSSSHNLIISKSADIKVENYVTC